MVELRTADFHNEYYIYTHPFDYGVVQQVLVFQAQTYRILIFTVGVS